MTAANVGTPPVEQEDWDGTGPVGTGELGVVAGLLTAIPLVGPALVAGCLGCVGVGAAAGVGLTAALPPRWWLAGLAIAAGAAAMVERRRARRCQRTAAPLRAGATLVMVAVAAWLVTRFGVLSGLDWATGSGGGPPGEPRLP
ncbi:MAG: hypothetical protein ABR540_12045 [Acidimicrobiales bacterium]